MHIQRITSPAGEELVVLSAEDFDRLIDSATDAVDIADARAALEEMRAEGGMPGPVLSAIIGGVSPVAAWRGHRGMSQAELAARAGVTQAAVARIEAAPAGAGRPATRKALAAALDAPLWSFDGAVDRG